MTEGIQRGWAQRQSEKFDEVFCQPTEFYQYFFDKAPVACFSVTTDGLIRVANDHALGLLGYRRDEVLGRPVFELYANGPTGKPKAQEFFLRFRAGLEISREHVEMRRADGSPLWIRLSVRSIGVPGRDMVVSCSVAEEIGNQNCLFQTTTVAAIPSSPETALAKSKSESGLIITGQKHATRLIVRSGRSIYFLDVRAVDWIEAAGNYAQLHVGSKVHLVRETMNRLEAELDPYQFIRVHRRAIVNVARMKELQPYSSGDCRLFLEDGTRLTWSRGYREKLRGISLG
jgi:PAS domain S-box-containing protein